MIDKIAQYKVKKEKLEIVLSALKEFIFAIERSEQGTTYKAFQHYDEISFTHFMNFPDEEAEKKHANSEHTKKFVEILYPNCEELPVFISLNKINPK